MTLALYLLVTATTLLAWVVARRRSEHTPVAYLFLLGLASDLLGPLRPLGPASLSFLWLLPSGLASRAMSTTDFIEPPYPGRAIEALDTALSVIRALRERGPDDPRLKDAELKATEARADLEAYAAGTKPASE